MATIKIVGLGAGDVDDLTLRAWRTLESADTVYLRTAHHACVPFLPQSTAYQSFDHFYEQHEAFEDVYRQIVDTLFEALKAGDVVYAVPGDPMVGESTPLRIKARAQAEGVQVEIIHGVSFIEPMLRSVGIDALDGLQIFDGLEIADVHHPPINPDFPALIGQVYSRRVASDVKLTLMNQYTDDFEVVLIHSAGTGAEQLERLPLYAIDRSEQINHLTSLYLPALGNLTSFEAFQGIIAHLRDPETGCPWDLKQTHESLRQFLLEETYEVLEAIDAGDTDELARELGDLLLQVVLHTQIAIDDGEFYMTDVLRYINEKMIRRHPHVFGDGVDVDNADQVVANWDAIKAQEKADDGKVASRLDGVPKALPALLRSYKYQDRAASVGFDWAVLGDVRAKLNEELDEVAEAETPEHQMEEFGDVLFVMVNWARWMQIDPENALRLANDKFYRRFNYIEQRLSEQGLTFDQTNGLDDLEALWQEAKAQGL